MTLQLNGTTGVDNIQPGVVQTADLAPLAVTPDKTSGFVITQANQTPLPGAAALISFTHNLGYIPASVEIELVCLTAQNGYGVGNVVTPSGVGSGSLIVPPTITKGTTTVDCRMGDVGAFYLVNGTTGGYFLPTPANWAWRFKVRAA